MSDEPGVPRVALETAIRRATIRSLSIYEVSESELQTLERGSADSTLLTLGIALLSVALSFTATLTTVAIESIRTYAVFVVITVVGYVSGVVLLVLWAPHRRAVSECVRRIRDRMPPEGNLTEGLGPPPTAM